VNRFTSILSNNLLTAATIAFITGIAFSSQLALSHTLFSATVMLFWVSIPLFFILFFICHPHCAMYFLIPLFAAAGCIHAQVHSKLPADREHIYNTIKQKQEVVFVGTMAEMAGFDGRMSSATLQLKSIRSKDDPAWRRTHGKVLIRLQGKWPDNILPGNDLAVRAIAKRPGSYKTPGVFDYARYLARKNIWVTASVRSPLLLRKIKKHDTFFHSLLYFPEKTRTKIGEYIDSNVPVDQAATYRAILLGDKTHLNETTLEAFKNSGTMHILAISGLHMAVIGSAIYFLIYLVLSRFEKLLLLYNIRKCAAFMTMPILILYSLLAGMNTPVLRSVIMSTILILAICSDRKKSPAPLIAFAALIILIVDPLQLYTVSFQLSFIATLSILFVFPILRVLIVQRFTDNKRTLNLYTGLFKWILAGLLVSSVATLSTIPLSLHFFHRISLVSPVSNLIIEPLICFWSLIAGFLALPFIWIFPDISALLFQAGAIGLDLAENAAMFFAHLPFSHQWLPKPSIWHIVIYYAGMLFLVVAGKKISIKSVAAFITFFISFLFFFFPPDFLLKKPHKLQITYLDVGQGSATLVEFPSRKQILIDGGGSSYSKSTVGERVIAPFLWNKGIQNLNIIAITHPDADHYNGLDFIAHHFTPKQIWVKNTQGHNERYRRIIGSMQRRGGSVTVPSESMTFGETETSLECIANIGNWKDISFEADNRNQANNGLILSVKTTHFTALFPGDIGRNAEKALVNKTYDLNADIVLSPHHGSKTSNSEEFLTASSPQFLIVSAGKSFKGKFPHYKLAPLCKKHNITLLTTANQGTIEIIAGNTNYQIYGYQKQNNNPLLPLKRYLIATKTQSQ